MLIKVFGRWINPDKIEYLSENDIYDEDSTTAFINYETDAVRFEKKTADELAEEINKQIKEQANGSMD